ncbi:hypothetical protein N7520_002365 [Penicillium odoratum]|uniref:uncharacterized protein n=1 Tax=Penicillium odoratum TaxID=1167516 RepID=UPI002547D267|nr:uncharacterized protein N7520_002365 [Penicillium odoratum]KAJ5771836.1 hypothetical protein N7520_002365 [Penicillium odoratum]
MNMFLLAGLAFAIWHHLYYHRLDGRIVTESKGTFDVSNQEWHAGFGTALAFLTKSCFAASITMAYKQYAWVQMRSRSYSVGGLDAIFAATSDLSAYISPDFIIHSRLAALVASFTWIMPFAALVTQATLTVVPSSKVTSNFSLVPGLNFYDPTNFQSSGLDSDVSPVLSRILAAAISIPGILPMNPIYANSTYNMTFLGPALHCIQPTDNETLSALKDAFDNEGRLYGSSGGGTIYLSYQNDSALWFRLLYESLTCNLRNHTYNVQFSASASTQIIIETPTHQFDDVGSRLSISYNAYLQALTNVFNGSIVIYVNAPQGQTADSAYAAIGSYETRVADTALISLIVDAIDKAASSPAAPFGASVASLQVQLSEVDRNLARNMTFAELMEEIARNATLSLFSDSRFWAKERNLVDVATTIPVNRHFYDQRNLLLAYGIAFGVSLVCLSLGIWALYDNGVSHGMAFSSILAATRNSQVNEITNWNTLGAEPMSETTLQAKLMFGVLLHEQIGCSEDNKPENVEGGYYAAFGPPEKISRIKKGMVII